MESFSSTKKIFLKQGRNFGRELAIQMHVILSLLYGMIRQINYGEILYGKIRQSVIERFYTFCFTAGGMARAVFAGGKNLYKLTCVADRKSYVFCMSNY